MDNSLQSLLLNIFQYAYAEGASDVHFAVGRRPVVRVNRELVVLGNFDVVTNDFIYGALEIMVGRDKANDVFAGKETDFSFRPFDELRLRGNAYIDINGGCISFRVVDRIKTLEELRLPKELYEFTKKKQGFFLVVGPVGHGKTTTMISMVNVIANTRKAHILTIENPIEYILDDGISIINQREVGTNTPDFHTALRASFRQDLDVIVIGEMRDADTISSAVTAAETGHLVLSTVHTNDAVQTIDRIIDSFPSDGQKQVRNQLAGTLLGIFSLRLLPSLKGGLVPAYELLINNPAVANLIREDRVYEIYRVLETSTQDGMVDFNRSLLELIRMGEIAPDVALNYSNNPEVLLKSL